jgi:hypothetical protein
MLVNTVQTINTLTMILKFAKTVPNGMPLIYRFDRPAMGRLARGTAILPMRKRRGKLKQ